MFLLLEYRAYILTMFPAPEESEIELKITL
jgi:hypothetical protein